MKLNNIQQMIIFFLWIIVLILSWVLYAVDKYYEEAKEKIDEYNFEQLENAKIVLEKIPEDANKFSTLKKFNEIYNAWIKPIKNCYYVSNSNWEYPYIFWFKLESKKYIKYYWTQYYAYPEYDLPFTRFCGGSKDCNDDIARDFFLSVISFSCDSENSMLKSVLN